MRSPGTRLLAAALATLALVLVPLAPLAAADMAVDWSGVTKERLLGDRSFPLDIDVAPDGAIWFAEIAGNVSRLDPATGDVRVMHTAKDVVLGGERGLVGFALAHDFADTGAFYIYYTQRTSDPDGGLNRLVRVEGGTERLLLTVPGAKEHNGGRIVVDTEGNLYVGTGENQLRDPAQDRRSLLGKILHVTPDGDPVEGNMEGPVYSIGHRNVYGLAIHPGTGELWETENSGWRRDEVNIVKAGGNYGYPECEGHGLNGVDTPCPTSKGYTFPLLTFYETHAVAPTGATFWKGGFYWASLNEGSIHHLWQDGDTWRDEIVLDHGDPILDIHASADGAFHFSSTDGIWRLDIPAGGTNGGGGSGDGSGNGTGDGTGNGSGGGDGGGTTAGEGSDGPAPKGETEGTPFPAPVAFLAIALASLAVRRRHRGV